MSRLQCLIAIGFSVLALLVRAHADEPSRPAADPLREVYREDAEKCQFATGDGKPLTLAKDSIMRWSTDDDWSGDVFAWTHQGRPEVVGCLLSGPGGSDSRFIWARVSPVGRKADRAERTQAPWSLLVHDRFVWLQPPSRRDEECGVPSWPLAAGTRFRGTPPRSITRARQSQKKFG